MKERGGQAVRKGGRKRGASERERIGVAREGDSEVSERRPVWIEEIYEKENTEDDRAAGEE